MDKLLNEMKQELTILNEQRLHSNYEGITNYAMRYQNLFADGESISWGDIADFEYLLEALILKLGDVREIIKITRELTENGITSYYEE